ncbi:MAG: SCP2 sterol-binding domain-containing protein [Anaerolineales bacterium]|nr:SCP2 sterol-binding domain-containing protein [Anaerolineales bacterium]MCX7608486.1 SCP2 sterol-binding domain-containing protein [Anaerolineales bacterium]MDW8226924.1 SCP2 sterol-binding domain-containing protein [Anaerolineales bacterium]
MSGRGMLLLQTLVESFHPAAAAGLVAEIQFLFSGVEKGAYYLKIENGKCTLHTGEIDFARLTIRVDLNVWEEIQTGKIRWSDALMQRKFLATGNFPLLARLPDLFTILASSSEKKNA